MQEKFRELLAKLDALKAEMARREGDEPEAPPPGASAERIAAVEKAIGKPLPESYRQFLALRDGSKDIPLKVLLNSTEDFLSNDYETFIDTMVWAVETEDEEAATETRTRLEGGTIIGWDDDGGTLLLIEGEEVVEFLFDETDRWDSLPSYLQARIDESLRESAQAIARELAEKLDEAVEESDFAEARKLLEQLEAGGTHYEGMDRQLVDTGLTALQSGETALAYELTALATRLPDPALQSFNNLAHIAVVLKDREKMLHAASRAMPHGPKNVPIYHNAACCFALAGDAERALEACRLAKEHGYKLMANMHRDEDLKILWDRPEFEALFK